jgi:hypothetical protein
MKHLSSILLSIGVILSVVAIILPQWTVVTADGSPAAAIAQAEKSCMATCDDPKQTPAIAKTLCETACKAAADVAREVPTSGHFGLWEQCSDGANGTCVSYSGDAHPKDILVSQILSIVGTVGLAVGAVMCMMMKPRYSKLAAGLGVACLTAVLIVYATVTNSKDNNPAASPSLSASFWLELSAAAVGLIGLFVPAAKK